MEFTRCDLTSKQKEVLLQVLHFSQEFAKQIGTIFKHYGMDKVQGTSLDIVVDPDMTMTTYTIQFGRWNCNAGHLTIAKGEAEDDRYAPIGTNTKELERLFVDGLLTEGKPQGRTGEKDLPPDGLWISRFDDPIDVDSGV